jgi:4-hydroxy 2-oxovalerate aldolase
MSAVKVLDCTLRDGGYVNNFNFGEQAIKTIISKLSQSSIDIVECGFLKQYAFSKDKTLYGNTKVIKDFIGNKKDNIMYVAMIAYGDIPNKDIEPCDGKSIDGIRITFHKHEIEEAFILGEQLINKGYKVFMQPVGTTSYDDISLLKLVEKVNMMKPYAFYLVDTSGTMYKNDLLRMFYLIDNNLDESISIGFHSHNNLQLSFSNAQELLLLHTKRQIIIDSSVFGMGRGAGNLCTELLTQYINKNIENKYNVVSLLEIIDEHINQIFMKNPWGYSIPYYIASVNNCHPNYASHLINKQTISVTDINNILKKMSDDKRTLYDKEYIEKTYLDFQRHKVDDKQTMAQIKEFIGDKNILILAPGKSLELENDKIQKYIQIKQPLIFSINFIPEKINYDVLFVSNLKRFNNILSLIDNIDENKKVIFTSNITIKSKSNVYIVNYSDYLNDNSSISDNAGLMLMNLLYKIGVNRIALAGFDGFSLNRLENYYKDTLINNVEAEELLKKNEAISFKLSQLNKSMYIEFVTKSIYDKEFTWEDMVI